MALSEPAVFYVDNFQNLPVGSVVPLGSLDVLRHLWVSEVNGRVIKILDVMGGMAEVDSDGDGVADDAATLALLQMIRCG